jgi:hypothetical protein
MSKIIVYLLPIILSLSISAQAQIGIGESGQPHPSAMLDMDMANNRQGVLLPRIPISGPTDKTSIPNPADYLLVFSPYTGTSSYTGLSYWHNSQWNNLLNQTNLYDSISAHRITQIILFARLHIPETTTHVTDNHQQTPYKLPLDSVVFDSQRAYDQTSQTYIIPEDGLYEIMCAATLNVAANITMQTFICVNQTPMINDLITQTSATGISVGSVVYTAQLKKGDRVHGAAGVGVWNKDTFKVVAGSLSILKY